MRRNIAFSDVTNNYEQARQFDKLHDYNVFAMPRCRSSKQPIKISLASLLGPRRREGPNKILINSDEGCRRDA